MSEIKKIRIRNFKNLEDVEIEVKPLTFLFGPNGSGKSSFLKAMMFLSKNLFPINNSFTQYNLDKDVDLESYSEIITNNKIESDLVYEVELKGNFYFIDERIFDLENYPEYLEYLKDGLFFLIENFLNALKTENFFRAYELLDEKHIGSVDINNLRVYKSYNYEIKIIVTFQQNPKNKNLKSIKIIDEKTSSFIEYDIFKTNEIIGNKNRKNGWFNCNFNFFNGNEYCNLLVAHYINILVNDFMGYVEYPEFPEKESFLNGNIKDTIIPSISIIPDNIIDKWLNISRKQRLDKYIDIVKFLELAMNIIPRNLRALDLFHLPSVREIPNSKYLLKDFRFDDKNYYNFLNQLYEDPSTSYLNKNIDKNINSNLKILGFNKKLKISKNNDVGSIFLVDNKSKKTNLSNESSGMIQILPILIGMELYNNISIEQPELHLHPCLQSLFGKVLANSVSDNNYKLIFIETHSEHLIRKIQVLIANGELDKEKVSVLYFNNKDGTTKVEKMEIDEKGLFKKDWPDRFFDDSVNLTMELFDAIRKHKN